MERQPQDKTGIIKTFEIGYGVNLTRNKIGTLLIVMGELAILSQFDNSPKFYILISIGMLLWVSMSVDAYLEGKKIIKRNTTQRHNDQV